MIFSPLAHIARGYPPFLKVLQHFYVHSWRFWSPLWIFLIWSPCWAAWDSLHIDHQNSGKQKLAIRDDYNVNDDFNAQERFITMLGDASITESLACKWRSVFVPLPAPLLLDYPGKCSPIWPRQEWSPVFAAACASKTSGAKLIQTALAEAAPSGVKAGAVVAVYLARCSCGAIKVVCRGQAVIWLLNW